MYLVHICHEENQECFDTYVQDTDELLELISYVRLNEPQMHIGNVERQYIIFGLDELKEIVEESENENKFGGQSEEK
jgi:hypothetical protein